MWSWSHIFTQLGWFIPFCLEDFPGQYKRQWKCALFLSHIFLEQNGPILLFSLTPTADHITMRRAHPIYGPLFSRKSFLQHLFIPPRPTDPQSFKLDVSFLFWPQYQLNSFSVFSNSILSLSSATQFLLWLQQLNSCSDISN